MVGFWTMFLIQIGLMLLLELIRPKQDQDQKPSPLGDFSVPTAQEDRAVPILFGTVRQNGPNVIWYGDYRAVPQTKRIRTGMISKETIVTGHKYYLGLQMALARGTIDKVTGLWVDDVQLFPGMGATAATDVWKAEYDTISTVGLVTSSQGSGRPAWDKTACGVNYVVNDTLSVAGADWVTAPTLTVSSVDSYGSITGLTVTDGGQIAPDDVPGVFANLSGVWLAAQGGIVGARAPYLSLTGGSGTGARIAPTFTRDLSGKPAGAAHVEGRMYADLDAVATDVTADGGALYINCPDLFGGDGDHGSGGVGGFVQFKNGSATQTAPAYMDENAQVDGVTMQYRGTAYACPVGEPFYLGKTTSIKKWAFEIQRIPDPLNLTTDATINGRDANPVNVLYEALTNTEWGLGIDASLIDSTNFAAAGATLATEGHGYSQLVDRELNVDKFIQGIEEQIDGVLYQDTDGLFKIVLARGDYTLAAQPEITETNRVSLEEFSRGTWSETTNMIYVSYADADDNWRRTFSVAQDQANINIQNGQPLSSTVKYSGVTNATLANDLAWRDLRSSSFPLAKATVTLDRNFWDLKPGEVVRFSDANLGLTDLPMRVRTINLGDLTAGTVRVSLVQDIFYNASGSFDPREGSSWTNPVGDQDPLAETVAIEVPRAVENRLAARDGVEPVPGRIYANAVGGPTMDEFDIYVGATVYGEGIQLKPLGRLSEDMEVLETQPLGSLAIQPIFVEGEEATKIVGQFVESTTSGELSTLDNLILIDGELMLVSSAALSGDTGVELSNVYRGVLDTAKAPHSAGTPVYQVAASGGSTDAGFGSGTQNVRLVPRGRTGEGTYAEATNMSLTLANRYLAPYCPSEISMNSTNYASSVTLTANGANADAYFWTLGLTRRDFRATEHITPLGTDAETIDASYPSANSTVHYYELVDEADTSLMGPTQFSGSSVQITRNDMLAAGMDPENDFVYVKVTSEHTVDSVTYSSVQAATHGFSVTWGLEGDFNFGVLPSSTASSVYTVDSAGVHNFALVSSIGGNVEYRVNGGSWTTLITSGSTSGATSSLSVSDTLEVRHLDGSLSTDHFLSMTAPGGGTDGYALLT